MQYLFFTHMHSRNEFILTGVVMSKYASSMEALSRSDVNFCNTWATSLPASLYLSPDQNNWG